MQHDGSRSRIRLLTGVTLDALEWAGLIALAWNLLEPGGWLVHGIALIVDNRPTSYYYLGVGVVAMLALKSWLDELSPGLATELVTRFTWAFAGTYLLLRLLGA